MCRRKSLMENFRAITAGLGADEISVADGDNAENQGSSIVNKDEEVVIVEEETSWCKCTYEKLDFTCILLALLRLEVSFCLLCKVQECEDSNIVCEDCRHGEKYVAEEECNRVLWDPLTLKEVYKIYKETHAGLSGGGGFQWFSHTVKKGIRG